MNLSPSSDPQITLDRCACRRQQAKRASPPVTSTQLLAAFAPLSLVTQRLRVAGELVDVLTPTCPG